MKMLRRLRCWLRGHDLMEAHDGSIVTQSCRSCGQSRTARLVPHPSGMLEASVWTEFRKNSFQDETS
jgi:hypothetical protein